jgi:hypothetical protein
MSYINIAYFSDLPSKRVSIDEQQAGDVCIANIGPRERKKRLKFAISQFIVTLIILGVLIALVLNPFWRMALLFMFSASTVSYFQALDKT